MDLGVVSELFSINLVMSACFQRELQGKLVLPVIDLNKLFITHYYSCMRCVNCFSCIFYFMGP